MLPWIRRSHGSCCAARSRRRAADLDSARQGPAGGGWAVRLLRWTAWRGLRDHGLLAVVVLLMLLLVMEGSGSGCRSLVSLGCKARERGGKHGLMGLLVAWGVLPGCWCALRGCRMRQGGSKGVVAADEGERISLGIGWDLGWDLRLRGV